MLNRLALRLATVRALRGKTYAGDKVLDSTLATIEDVAVDNPTPVISVYTDDGHFRNHGRSLFDTTGDHRHDVGFQRLIIEIALSMRMRLRDGDGNEIEEAVPLETDASAELTLDMIERQVKTALEEPDNVWSEMWRDFALEIGDHESKRGQGARDGVRFSGRQITIHCKLPFEQPKLPEAEMWPRWQRFFALAATDAGLTQVATAMRGELVRGAPQTDWDALQTLFGFTTPETRALGRGPLTVGSIQGVVGP